MNEAFLKLLQVCDSVFPVGAYTLSNGLETYVQKELLTTPETLDAYLRTFLRALSHGDLAVAAHAHAAASDPEAVARLDSLCAASRAAREIREGSRKMCARFFKLAKSMGTDVLAPYEALVKAGRAVGQYPVAFGIYAGRQGAAADDALAAFAYSQCSAVVINCVKLVPLRQSDGQRILYTLLPEIARCAKHAQTVPQEEIGLAMPGLEIRAMQHERLVSRQYIS